MKKSVIFSVLCGISACAFLFSTSMAYASWKVQDDTINKITMGSVRGQILEEFEQDVKVYPDSEVTKVVQVSNTGTIDAIPRVKIEKVWGDSRDENGNLLINPDLSTDNIEITYNDTNWTYNPEDGYYYYNGVLSPGEKTESLFDSFRINGDKTGKEYRNKFADIIVTMEMIQAAGDALSYWGMTYDDLGIIYDNTQKEQIITSVTFQNPEEGFTFDVNGGDLFANFKNLIPGESRSQIIDVTNMWDQSVGIYFWADYIDQENADERTEELVYQLLHEYANIIITDENGDIIYDGPIWGALDKDSYDRDSMKSPYYLGNFSSGQTKTVNVSLYLSPQMDNEYLSLLGLVKWVFSAEGESAPTVTTTTESIQTVPIQTSTSTEPVQTDAITEPIQTSTSTEPTQTDTITEPIQTSTITEPIQTSTSTEPIQTDTITEPIQTSTSTEPIQNGSTEATTQSTTANTSKNITNTEYTSAPKTGDNFNLKLYLSLMAGSLIMLSITFRKSKEKDENA